MWKPESSTLIEQNYDLIAIGLGSNIGRKKYNISRALQLINEHRDCAVIAVSRLYLTLPWGKTDQDLFLNAVALIRTEISPEHLLDILFTVENNLKRKRNDLWGPRTIDLDILFFKNYELSTERLTIPHPYITQRSFVMVPLADVAAHISIDGLSVANWIEQMDVSGIKVVDYGCNWWTNYN